MAVAVAAAAAGFALGSSHHQAAGSTPPRAWSLQSGRVIAVTSQWLYLGLPGGSISAFALPATAVVYSTSGTLSTVAPGDQVGVVTEGPWAVLVDDQTSVAATPRRFNITSGAAPGTSRYVTPAGP